MLAQFAEFGCARLNFAKVFLDLDFLGALIMLQKVDAVLFRVDVAPEVGVLQLESLDFFTLFHPSADSLRSSQRNDRVGCQSSQCGEDGDGS